MPRGEEEAVRWNQIDLSGELTYLTFTALQSGLPAVRAVLKSDLGPLRVFAIGPTVERARAFRAGQQVRVIGKFHRDAISGQLEIFAVDFRTTDAPKLTGIVGRSQRGTRT